ncbi:peptidase inhibitor family I36 protein [Actinomadura harenae]|nr:peptidase inhibitor family I36 protein [Actinomadura harenae]
MMNPRTLTRTLPLALIASTAILTGTSTAFAATPTPGTPDSIQTEINDQLRAHPGGVQTGPNEITYKNGKVILSIPSNPTVVDTCASGAYCFFDGPDFTGRMLTFRDCGGWQYLTDYGFGNKTSSWTNLSKNTVKVYDEDVSPRAQLWTMAPGAAAANVGSAAYNKADSFLTYCP